MGAPTWGSRLASKKMVGSCLGEWHAYGYYPIALGPPIRSTGTSRAAGPGRGRRTRLPPIHLSDHLSATDY